MKNIEIEKWRICQTSEDFQNNRFYESIMSIGNSQMGIRGNFEEFFSGDSLRGTYIAGVYELDRTKVGWWKNGYPEYYAKTPNAPNFLGIDIYIDEERIDLNRMDISDFKRVLDMKNGVLERSCIVTYRANRRARIDALKFLCMADKNLAFIRLSITPLDSDCRVRASMSIDGGVSNEDSNYGDFFWEEVKASAEKNRGFLNIRTIKSKIPLCMSMNCRAIKGGSHISSEDFSSRVENMKVSSDIQVACKKGESLELFKHVACIRGVDSQSEGGISNVAISKADNAAFEGFESLIKSHSCEWEKLWRDCDVNIIGNDRIQGAVRFCIFNMLQTYTSHDPKLNIGPKGFTGEKYGGGTYWDTEAFCLPFYMLAMGEGAGLNLLEYRRSHLEKARQNAAKLGLEGALYPMVTVTGEECHNEWEITFEEIHRNGAIARAIHFYSDFAPDDYALNRGLEVIVETARFWASRSNWSDAKRKYVILGVTGPNEYENNVNNNWYTNFMAAWNMVYAARMLKKLKEADPCEYKSICEKLGIEETEVYMWRNISSNMFMPVMEGGIFEQNEGFRDKSIYNVSEIGEGELPLWKNWSWDRILRSCFVKQADVLQLFYMFSEEFEKEAIRKNFDYYEPLTVHESSLSPLVHSIVASIAGYKEEAFYFFERSVFLDLSNLNGDTEDGLHITSMSGAYNCVALGFARIRAVDGTLHIDPFIPKGIEGYSFGFFFRGRRWNLSARISSGRNIFTLSLDNGEPVGIFSGGKSIEVEGGKEVFL